MIKEHDIVTLAVNKPKARLRKGAKGTVIHIYFRPTTKETHAYCVEFPCKGSLSPRITDVLPSELEEK